MTCTRNPRLRLALAPLLLLAAAPRARGQIFDYAIEGSDADSYFGSSISRVGDVDSDGCDDFIVGAPVDGLGQWGLATVYSGKTGASIASWSGNIGSGFGFAVEGKIDVDGDGFPDVLIGAPYDSSVRSIAGLVDVYSPHRHKRLYHVDAPVGAILFGAAIRSIQDDLDGDGVDDFVVGAPWSDTAYVCSGATGTVIFTKSGQVGSQFGASVSRGGNLDGDGKADFVVGSPYYVDGSGSTTGRIAAFAGKDGSKLWAIDGAADSGFSWDVAQPGDLDGDGYGDLVVGAADHLDPNGKKTGCATVISGATANVLYKVYGDHKDDEFGVSVRGVGGDIDGDGTNDFIVGAEKASSAHGGYARVISGATGATLFTCTMHSSDPTSQTDYGNAVAGGDFDGDGRTDVVVCGSGFDNSHGLVETWLTAVAKWQNYGAGWPGALGVPTLTAQNDPAVGGALDLDLSNSAGVATTSLLLIGVSDASIATGKGGTILVDPLLFLALPLPATGITLSGHVPDDPTLYGFDLYLQAIELDAGASKGLSFTSGLDLTFGFD